MYLWIFPVDVDIDNLSIKPSSCNDGSVKGL